ncbi:MAG: DUF2309 domain-containing protein [Planctomycetes bacterium]|nr:DUF2309 domain-containing protein [Planctomycetota bacterium]
MNQTGEDKDIREELLEAIAHLEHILPGQAPIKDFVHHNTLHGFQHFPFPQAITEARKVTGAWGYLPVEQFREYLKQGRIDIDDLNAILAEDDELDAKKSVAPYQNIQLNRVDVFRTALLHDIKAISAHQLTWQTEEHQALTKIQRDVPPEQAGLFFKRARSYSRSDRSDKKRTINDLWQACLQTLGLEHFVLHPEDLTDLSAEHAERMFRELEQTEQDNQSDQLLMHQLVRKESGRLLLKLIDKVGVEITLRGFLQAITGEDIFDQLRPTLLRHLSLFLDHGIASWHASEREKGFYDNWRSHVIHDPAWIFEDLWDWHDEISNLPDDPLDTILFELRRIGFPRTRWAGYLERLALELPGWSGMFNWHAHHPNYQGFSAHVSMTDYLAVRLILERLYAQRLCRRTWQLEARLDIMRWYFRHHRSELIVRYVLFNERLPEYLATPAQNLVQGNDQDSREHEKWINLAEMIWTWRHSPAADRAEGYTAHRSAWPLFRLAQHLGLPAPFILNLHRSQLDEIFACIDLIQSEKGSYIWLRAYERHYREEIFNALANNRGRGRWRVRETRPSAQIVFCMDDREEGIRRHLEEIDPHVETLGAAGFFGVAMNWQGLDDRDVTPLCPIVVTPSHQVKEIAQSEEQKAKHDKRRGLRIKLKDILHQEIRRNLVSSTLLMLLLSPFILLLLIGKLFMPRALGRKSDQLQQWIDRSIQTDVRITAESDSPATTEQPRDGFTDIEQADRVENFLKMIGLTKGFAPLVVMMGHGSSSQNNPHIGAYDCGACSGRHGGPNARVFAAMANRKVVRAILKNRGIAIPEDTWFLGAEHATCHDRITWYDLDKLPKPHSNPFVQLERNLDQACAGSAHERSRRFASASLNMNAQHAYQHVLGRAYDFSQARPELGHATNAAAFIGRRAISQGAFFDRRTFLISYDPTIDADGLIIEAILLAVGPVGSGINLEYYFSTVNNERYGCGTKIMHNVTGMFGVMEGASSDLRTGLPQQMIEIHEAMRLLVVVEQTTDCLGLIYNRQQVLQELVGNEWVYLATMDPQTGDLSLFIPKKGFVPWKAQIQPLQMVASSVDWYQGHRDPLSPVLIETTGGYNA